MVTIDVPLYKYQGNQNKRQRDIGSSAVEQDWQDSSNRQAKVDLEKRNYKLHHIAFSIFSTKVLNNDSLLLFLQELVSLLMAGFTVTSVLTMMIEKADQNKLQTVLRQILTQIERGESFSIAVSDQPGLFDSYLISMIKIGEKSGDLVQPIQRYISFLKMKITLSRKIQQALMYPLFLVITLIFVISALFIFVLPRFAEMYAGFNVELPGATLLLISAVEQMHLIVPLLIILVLALLVSYAFIKKSERATLYKDSLITKIPLLGRIINLYHVAQITRILAILLKSGTSMVEALRHTAAGVSNTLYRAKLYNAATSVTEGIALSKALENARILPVTSLKLVSAGEESGRLDELLINIAEYNELMLDHIVNKITSLIEPLIMLIIGIFVGGIILTMYLPIFSVADIIQ